MVFILVLITGEEINTK